MRIKIFPIVMTVLALIMCMFFMVALAHAAVDDATALTMAKKLWGPNASLQKVRPSELGSSNWTYQIGIRSQGCAEKMVVMGQGLNTWDAAFADYNLKLTAGTGVKVGGPFKGNMNLQVRNYDKNVTAFRFFTDGLEFPTSMPNTVTIDPMASGQALNIQTVDTTKLGKGFHAICVKSLRMDNASGLSKTLVFQVDQAVPGNVSGDWSQYMFLNGYAMGVPYVELSITSATLQNWQPDYGLIPNIIPGGGPQPQTVQPSTPTPPLPDGVLHAWTGKFP